MNVGERYLWHVYKLVNFQDSSSSLLSCPLSSKHICPDTDSKYDWPCSLSLGADFESSTPPYIDSKHDLMLFP